MTCFHPTEPAPPTASSYIRVERHWAESLPGVAQGRVVLSELPRGDSPVNCGSFCLNLVITGIERYEIDGRVHVVEPGQFLLIDAGTRSRVVLPRSTITRGLCIYLPHPNGSVAPADKVEAGAPMMMARSFQMSEATVPFARTLARLGNHVSQHGPLSPASAARVVRRTAQEIGAISAELASKTMRADAARPSTRAEIVQRIERARSYIHDHDRQTVSLPELAAVAGMSQFHFARSFRAVIGAAPIDYHSTLRMQTALELLRRDHPIAWVAYQIGFADQSSFARAFRRVTGTNPGSVRKRG